MTQTWSTPLFVLGLLLLTGGAELLVRGAGDLARRLGLSPVVIGLTVVAIGTSAPELAVSVDAALSGSGGISMGNVVGSNIFNVLSVLGVTALAAPLVVSARLIRFDVPVMIGASVLLLLLALDGRVGRLDGTLLFLLGVAYLALLLSRRAASSVSERSPRPAGSSDDHAPRSGWLGIVVDGGLVVAGLGMLVAGSHWLVGSAVGFARSVGVSEMVVGLTLVATGTSLPEMATSVVAAIRGEREMAVGNVVGSNVTNLFLVLGPTAMISSTGVGVPAEALTFDLPIMTAAAVACLPIFFTGSRISRWEGGVFFGYYVAYVSFLVADATGTASARFLGAAIVWFVLPLTILTVGIFVVRQLRSPPPTP